MHVFVEMLHCTLNSITTCYTEVTRKKKQIPISKWCQISKQDTHAYFKAWGINRFPSQAKSPCKGEVFLVTRRDTVYSVIEGYVIFYTTGCLLPPGRSGKTLVSLCPASSCTPRQTCLSLLKYTESSKKPRSFGISRGTEASPAAAPSDTSVCCPLAARSHRKGLAEGSAPRKGPESQERAAATHLQGDTGWWYAHSSPFLQAGQYLQRSSSFSGFWATLSSPSSATKGDELEAFQLLQAIQDMTPLVNFPHHPVSQSYTLLCLQLHKTNESK